MINIRKGFLIAEVDNYLIALNAIKKETKRWVTRYLHQTKDRKLNYYITHYLQIFSEHYEAFKGESIEFWYIDDTHFILKFSKLSCSSSTIYHGYIDTKGEIIL